jgi:alanine dehydrogenase
MLVGILKEIKSEENRVSMTPAGVEVMKHNEHTMLVEKHVGAGSGFEDAQYVEHGAEIVNTPQRFLSEPIW